MSSLLLNLLSAINRYYDIGDERRVQSSNYSSVTYTHPYIYIGCSIVCLCARWLGLSWAGTPCLSKSTITRNNNCPSKREGVRPWVWVSSLYMERRLGGRFSVQEEIHYITSVPYAMHARRTPAFQLNIPRTQGCKVMHEPLSDLQLWRNIRENRCYSFYTSTLFSEY